MPMNGAWYFDEPYLPERDNLRYAHGTVMVIAWILLASTGILLARYGRSLHFVGLQRLLGNAIWFQIHRFILCLVTVATLLGFFLALVKEKGQWVTSEKDGGRIFAHSILGGIIVCSTLLQSWFALFRCHVYHKLRPIFNWTHRGLGFLSFFLSVPTIFLVLVEPKAMPVERDGFIAILSIWSAWVVIIVVLFEGAQYSLGAQPPDALYHIPQEQSFDHPPIATRRKMNSDPIKNNRSLNNVKLFLFFLHIIVSVSLTIPLIVLIWQQT